MQNCSSSKHYIIMYVHTHDIVYRPSASELLKLPFFKKAKNKEFIKEVVLQRAPSLQSRARQVKRRPGASGRLHRTEEGGWVWSDDEMTEEFEAGSQEEDKEKSKV